MARGPVLPDVDAVVELFRRTDADRNWLADRLADRPSRLLYVGHATAAESGRADDAALYLADDRPLTASDVMSMELVMPPRVALLACASGGDYRFDEATGLVAAAVLGGAQLVTATLWSLPTTAGYQQFTQLIDGDPMAGVIIAVDQAHAVRGGGLRGQPLATGPDAKWRGATTGQPCLLGGPGHVHRRRRPPAFNSAARTPRRTTRPRAGSRHPRHCPVQPRPAPTPEPRRSRARGTAHPPAC